MKGFVDGVQDGMTAAATRPISDDELVRYLLGVLPAEERERLEERSIVDEEIAERLVGLEQDLVDGYAAGTLTGERLREPDPKAAAGFPCAGSGAGQSPLSAR